MLNNYYALSMIIVLAIASIPLYFSMLKTFDEIEEIDREWRNYEKRRNLK